MDNIISVRPLKIVGAKENFTSVSPYKTDGAKKENVTSTRSDKAVGSGKENVKSVRPWEAVGAGQNVTSIRLVQRRRTLHL